jgi:hypothetical protein
MPRRTGPNRFTLRANQHGLVRVPKPGSGSPTLRDFETIDQAAPIIRVRLRKDGRVREIRCSCSRLDNAGTCFDVWERSAEFVRVRPIRHDDFALRTFSAPERPKWT